MTMTGVPIECSDARAFDTTGIHVPNLWERLRRAFSAPGSSLDS